MRARTVNSFRSCKILHCLPSPSAGKRSDYISCVWTTACHWMGQSGAVWLVTNTWGGFMALCCGRVQTCLSLLLSDYLVLSWSVIWCSVTLSIFAGATANGCEEYLCCAVLSCYCCFELNFNGRWPTEKWDLKLVPNLRLQLKSGLQGVYSLFFSGLYCL